MPSTTHLSITVPYLRYGGAHTYIQGAGPKGYRIGLASHFPHAHPGKATWVNCGWLNPRSTYRITRSWAVWSYNKSLHNPCLIGLVAPLPQFCAPWQNRPYAIPWLQSSFRYGWPYHTDQQIHQHWYTWCIGAVARWIPHRPPTTSTHWTKYISVSLGEWCHTLGCMAGSTVLHYMYISNMDIDPSVLTYNIVDDSYMSESFTYMIDSKLQSQMKWWACQVKKQMEVTLRKSK